MKTLVWPGAIYGALSAVLLALVAAVSATPTRSAATGASASADPEFVEAASTRRLVWFDRQGTMTVVPAPPRGYAYPRLAPDGRSAALDIRDQRHGLWRWTIGSGRLAPLSVGRASDIAPVWSRTGDRLLFARGRGAAPGLWVLTLSTGAVAPLPVQTNSLPLPASLTPDGRDLLVTVSVATGFDIISVDVAGGGQVRPVVTAAADDLNPEVSPDGRWLAYQSRASGQFEIWLKPLAGGDAKQLTGDGGTRPVWTRGGRELIYLTNDGTVKAMAVGDGAGGMPIVSLPDTLFRADVYRDLVGRTFDVTADGLRILAIVDSGIQGRAWY